MKILCISDATDPLVYSENIVSRYGDVDLIIAAGDLNLKYYEFIISSLNKPLFFVFGNHNLEHIGHFIKNDSSSYSPLGGTEHFQFPCGGEFIDGKVIRDRKSGLIIAGLGGSKRYNNGSHQFTERQMFARMLKMVPRLLFNRIFHGRYLDILVTHAAPLGIGDDTDLCHHGFSTFLTFMERFRPKYLLHGHIHLVDMNANRHHMYKQTQIINIYSSYILEDETLGRGQAMSRNLSTQTNEDFEKAKTRGRIQSVLSTLAWKNSDLLSFYAVTDLIKPRNETYRGMRTIPISQIIGSEGRYQDFSQAFYPKKELLRSRWRSIDGAVKQYIILPPISVYKVGQWYFVRDGNHRVSVAKAQGVEFIDAEVVELDSEIPLEAGLTMKQLRRRVTHYERKRFIEQYSPTYLPMDQIVFSSPGSYAELVHHIQVHKYYINQGKSETLSFEEGARSWYENVYKPIIEEVRLQKLLAAFPGTTEADLYMWIVRHWDNLKHMSGSHEVSIESAASDYKTRFGKGALRRFIDRLKNAFSRE